MTLELTPEELKKVLKLKGEENPLPEPEWYLIAKLGKAFGWGAIEAVLEDRVDMETVEALINAYSAVEARERYQRAEESFIGAGSVRAKNPSKAFNELTRTLKRAMKVKE